MKNRTCAAGAVAAAFWLFSGAPAQAQHHPQHPPASSRETVVTTRASGTFEVKLAPQAGHEPALGRMTIDKEFHGDLEAVSKGEMLAAMTAVEGSAGYVAMERVSGTLHGRRGTFVLQHSGTMNRGAPQLVVTVVPDSGTDELAGLSGTMRIIVEGGKHSYELDYTLAPRP